MSRATTNWRGVGGTIVALTGFLFEICAVLSHEYPEPPGVPTLFFLVVGAGMIAGGAVAAATGRKGGDM